MGVVASSFSINIGYATHCGCHPGVSSTSWILRGRVIHHLDKFRQRSVGCQSISPKTRSCSVLFVGYRSISPKTRSCSVLFIGYQSIFPKTRSLSVLFVGYQSISPKTRSYSVLFCWISVCIPQDTFMHRSVCWISVYIPSRHVHASCCLLDISLHPPRHVHATFYAISVHAALLYVRFGMEFGYQTVSALYHYRSSLCRVYRYIYIEREASVGCTFCNSIGLMLSHAQQVLTFCLLQGKMSANT